MESNASILRLMMSMLFMGGTGYGLIRLKLVGKLFRKWMIWLLLNMVLPLGILGTSDTRLDSRLTRGIGMMVIFAILYYIVSILLLRWLAQRTNLSSDKKKVWVMTGIFANSAFIGLPLVLELWGNEGLLYGVIHGAVYNIFMFTFGIGYLEGGKRLDWKGCIGNPMMIATIASVILLVSPMTPPKSFYTICHGAGGIIMPVSMILTGCYLGDLNIKRIWTDRSIWSVSGLRLCILPFMAAVLLKLTGWPDALCSVCVLLTGLPAGTLNGIMAEKHGGASGFAAEIILHSTCLMLFTLPCLLWAVQLIF